MLPAALAYTSRAIIDALLVVGAHSPVSLAGVYLVLLVAQQVTQSVLLLATETLTEAGARNMHVAIMATGARLEGLTRFESPEFHNRRLLLERNALYLPMNGLRVFLIGLGMLRAASVSRLWMRAPTGSRKVPAA